MDTNQYEGETGSFRILQFSEQLIQGAVDLNDPQRILFPYVAAKIELMEHYNPAFKDVFMIGHGVGSLAKNYINSDKRFKVAEIDPEVVKVSKEYFGYPSDNIIVSDGRRLLQNEPDKQYDFILLDAFSADSIPFHLTTNEFFRIARAKLKPDGYIIANVIGTIKGDQLINSMFRTLKEQYAFVSAYTPDPHSDDSQNILLVASALQLDSPSLSLFQEVKLEAGELITDLSPGHWKLN
jgi:spermidine synthase